MTLNNQHICSVLKKCFREEKKHSQRYSNDRGGGILNIVQTKADLFYNMSSLSKSHSEYLVRNPVQAALYP